MAQDYRQRGHSPRSIERGPVEASCLELAGIGRSVTLRAQLSAAPLKLSKEKAERSVGMGSPRSIERGPVEALHRLRRWSPRHTLSALN